VELAPAGDSVAGAPARSANSGPFKKSRARAEETRVVALLIAGALGVCAVLGFTVVAFVAALREIPPPIPEEGSGAVPARPTRTESSS
jgi:hypothetical protein